MRPAKLIVAFLLLASLAGNVILYVRFRGKRPIITVNGSVITRKELLDHLEQMSGPNVKAQLVERILIKNAAEKAGVWPKDEEINEIYNQQKELDWQFARRVATNPWIEYEEKENIRHDLSRQRLLAKEVEVTEEMKREEYNNNKFLYDTPAKARVHLAVLFRKAPVDEVRKMMEKSSPQVSPADIARAFPGQVVFLGDKDVFTIRQPFGVKSASSQLTDVFNLAPGQVREFPAEELKQMGGQTILARMAEVLPGKAADLSDPKINEKLRLAAALRRSKPWQEYLVNLWNAANFESVDPSDKSFIEMVFFPDRVAAQTPK